MRIRTLAAAAMLGCVCSGLLASGPIGLQGGDGSLGAAGGTTAGGNGAGTAETVLNIEDAVALAVAASDELRFARLERSIAAERARLSLRSFLPAVSLDYAQNDSVVYGAADSRLKRLSVGLSQVLFAKGSRISGCRVQNLELGLQSRALEQARAALVLEVTNLYLDALRLRLERGILEESCRNIQVQVRIAAEELRLGEITELAYLELVLAAKDQELELARRRQAEERSSFELREALGLEGQVRLTGTIDEDYRGLLETREPQWFVEACLSRNLELRRQEVELYGLRMRLTQCRLSWLPEVKASAELSMAGEQFPLTEPGFSLGVDFEFAAPVLPATAASTVGASGPRQRSAGISGSFGVGDNLEGMLAVRLAALELERAASRREAIRRGLEFTVRERLQSIAHQREAFALLREKRAIGERTQAVRSLMVDLGEITRLELVEGEAELAGLRVELLACVVTLFNLEVSLLEQCGLPGLETSYRAILRGEGGGP
ncbi:MAG: TolC family protein [Spirochaetales bacterium]|nr:TolC family protein [Spirochaetales bacterium]